MLERSVGMSVVLLGSVIVGVVMLVYRLYRESQKDSRVWVPVGTLEAINLYPLKSGAPTKVQHARCRNQGMSYCILRDRMFIVYDEQMQVVTAETSPKLMKIQVLTTSTPNIVRLISLTGKDFFDVDISKDTGYIVPVSMKFPMTDVETVQTQDCGNEAAAWICSELCRSGVRLGVWQTEIPERDIMAPRAREVGLYKLCNRIAGAYTNLSSYVLLNCASVEDLVSRLSPKTTVGTANFRGNILVSGAQPYAEDYWLQLKIGNAIFRIIKPCVRCSLVNINPKTLVTDPNMEPLKTLKSYRQLSDPVQREIEGDSPVMGCYMSVITPGEIKVGDPVYALLSPFQ